MRALSGQLLTQAMQPTHRSAMNWAGRRQVAEVAHPGGPGRDHAPREAEVRRQLLVGGAAPICRDDRVVELVLVQAEIECRHPERRRP